MSAISNYQLTLDECRTNNDFQVLILNQIYNLFVKIQLNYIEN